MSTTSIIYKLVFLAFSSPLKINSRLHTPMYFFLCNLAFLDLCCSSNALPKLLADLFSLQRIISFKACVFQLYASLFLGGTECLLLALMAYDRYVAICRPLYYTIDTLGRGKAFSTCTSHLTVVVLFFGTALVIESWFLDCCLSVPNTNTSYRVLLAASITSPQPPLMNLNVEDELDNQILQMGRHILDLEGL
ncbi:olfactory receptor 5G29-like [Discoglossus pictus]